MLRRMLLTSLVGLVILGVAACDSRYFNRKTDTAKAEAEGNGSTAAKVDIGNPLYPPSLDPDPQPVPPKSKTQAVAPVVVSDCRLAVFEKEEVPAMHDGRILFLGTPLKAGEETSLPPGKIITMEIGGETRKFRELVEDDEVVEKQLLGILDDQLARDDLAIKGGKIDVAKAEHDAAVKTKEEAYKRWETQIRLRNSGGINATSMEDLRAAELLYNKSHYEALAKEKGIRQAELERNQSLTVVNYHEIRANIPGVIKTFYKFRGDAVKNLEPVLQIRNMKKLRAEGLVDLQYVGRLRKEMKAVVEYPWQEAPKTPMIGHLQEITSVAVGTYQDKALIVSASEDGTVRAWDRQDAKEKYIFRLPLGTVGRTLACSPATTNGNWCVCGATDGLVRMWNLDNNNEPERQLKGHKGAVTSVAFSPDGKYFATGGEDKTIRLWETAKGEQVYQFPALHRGTITHLQFTPQSQLVSVSRDNSLRLWTVGEKGARAETPAVDHRSGDLPQLGVSPDGRRVLFDLEKSLRLLSLPKMLTEGELRPASGTDNFTTLALFSPDGNLILTGAGSEGRLQLWHAPTATEQRPYQVRTLVPSDHDHSAVTCAAFSPDGKFLVTGNRDRRLFIWEIPPLKALEQKIEAKLTLVEQFVETSAGQVRIRAEFDNPPNSKLMPGSTVALVIP